MSAAVGVFFNLNSIHIKYRLQSSLLKIVTNSPAQIEAACLRAYFLIFHIPLIKTGDNALQVFLGFRALKGKTAPLYDHFVVRLPSVCHNSLFQLL